MASNNLENYEEAERLAMTISLLKLPVITWRKRRRHRANKVVLMGRLGGSFQYDEIDFILSAFYLGTRLQGYGS